MKEQTSAEYLREARTRRRDAERHPADVADERGRASGRLAADGATIAVLHLGG